MMHSILLFNSNRVATDNLLSVIYATHCSQTSLWHGNIDVNLELMN
ncbi:MULTISPECIES: hypothetical protein [Nostocales]|nr:hypothetical protein [Tolypothrix bouteillei]